MSIKIMTAVWATVLNSHTDKLILLALADNANDEGECYPSITALAGKCNAHVRTVERAVAALEQDGHISREFRSGRSSLYRVHPRQKVTPDSKSPPAQSQDTPGTESPPPPAERRGTPGRAPGITIIEPSIEPSLNRQGARARRKSSEPKSEEPPPSNLNVEAWHRWEQYRRSIRKPIHPASRLSAQRKLAGFGADQDAVVEQSIANGWQGLFDLKRSVTRTAEPERRWAPSDDEEADHASG